MNLIEVQGLKKDLDRFRPDRCLFTVEKGDVIAVIGPSGAGKSTMLRCLIGLERVDGGSITVEGEPFVKNGVYASPAEAKRTTAKWGWCFSHSTCFRTCRYGAI